MPTLRGSFRALHRALVRIARGPVAPPRIVARAAEEQARANLAADLRIDPSLLAHDATYGATEDDDLDFDGASPPPNTPIVSDVEGTEMAPLPFVSAYEAALAQKMNSHDVDDDSDGIQKPPRVSRTILPTADSPEDSDPAEQLPLVAGPSLPRDAKAVMLLTQLRFLSLRQLAALAYPGTDISVTRRRVRVLARQGWVKVWSDWSAPGGHPKFVFPTRQALAFAYPHILEDTRGTAAETIVRGMIPQTPRKPLKIEGRVPPLHFQHQVEVNEIAAALARAYGSRLLWISSWDSPFPDTARGFLPLPQPDLVAIIDIAGAPHLLFVELDRRPGGVTRWVDRKPVAYTLNADEAEEHFGFRTFIVLAVISDRGTRNPMRRLRRLMHASVAATDAGRMRFSLLSWVTPDVPRRCCLRGSTPPESESSDRAAHANLVPLFTSQPSPHDR